MNIVNFFPLLLCIMLQSLTVEGAPLACERTCEEGYYCNKTCYPCLPGEFQAEALYRGAYCKAWTKKPVNSHYVIKENGTAISDIKYECEVGYKEVQYGSVIKCDKIQPTTPSTTAATTTTTTPPSSLATNNASTTEMKENGNNDTALVIGLTVGFLFLFLVVVAVVLLRNRILLCFSKFKNSNEQSECDQYHPLLPTSVRKYYKTCKKIILDGLGNDIGEKFLLTLPDKSGKFDAHKLITKKSKESRVSEEYLTEVFEKWAIFNRGLNREVIQQKLDFVGRPNLINELGIEDNEFGNEDDECNEAANGDPGGSDPSPVNGDEIRVSLSGHFKASEIYLLFYSLYSDLGDEVTIFLQRFPDIGVDKLNVYGYFENIEHTNSSENCFAMTLYECYCRVSVTLFSEIKAVLEDMELTEILGMDNYRILYYVPGFEVVSLTEDGRAERGSIQRACLSSSDVHAVAESTLDESAVRGSIQGPNLSSSDVPVVAESTLDESAVRGSIQGPNLSSSDVPVVAESTLDESAERGPIQGSNLSSSVVHAATESTLDESAERGPVQVPGLSGSDMPAAAKSTLDEHAKKGPIHGSYVPASEIPSVTDSTLNGTAQLKVPGSNLITATELASEKSAQSKSTQKPHVSGSRIASVEETTSNNKARKKNIKRSTKRLQTPELA